MRSLPRKNKTVVTELDFDNVDINSMGEAQLRDYMLGYNEDQQAVKPPHPDNPCWF